MASIKRDREEAQKMFEVSILSDTGKNCLMLLGNRLTIIDIVGNGSLDRLFIRVHLQSNKQPIDNEE